jgi:hypothetical protein
MRNKNQASPKQWRSRGLTRFVAVGLVMSTLACACSQTNKPFEASVERDFNTQRTALISKLSKTDGVFAALNAQVDPSDPKSEQYWQWRIDQYLYGQYPEYQQLYDAF